MSALVLAIVPMALSALEPAISEAVRSPDGVRIHTAHTPYQQGPTSIRVLLPDRRAPERGWPVIYVLPVEARDGREYGDGLEEVRRSDLPNRLGALFVAPSFSTLPWYADHPSDPEMRQESYFLEVVVPFNESTYPTGRSPESRHLLGFSKSGWGSWSLLLRHPDLFGRAAAWDAPLAMAEPGRYGSGPLFATRENFEKYHVARLIAERAGSLKAGPPRLVLLGFANFQNEQAQTSALLSRERIPFMERIGPRRPHRWDSGWVAEAAELLLDPR